MEWDFLWMMYRNSNVADEKNLILVALAASKKIRLLYRYLEHILLLKSDDALRVFVAIASNDLGYDLAMTFLKSHIVDIYKLLELVFILVFKEKFHIFHFRMEQKPTALGDFITSLASRISTTDEYKNVKFNIFLCECIKIISFVCF